MKPTLLVAGNLRPPTPVSAAEEAELKKWVPMDYIIEWFKSRIGKTGVENRVLILKSETASGKSTVLPPQIYNSFVRGGKKDMICTQPRVLTAISNVNTILEHNPFELGRQIGWYTKNYKVRTTTPALISSTVGTLTEQLKTMSDSEIRQKYQFILIDEVHERDLPTDLCIYMLKKFIDRNADQADCPFVVFMSATFSPQPFLDYFSLDIHKNFIWCVGHSAGFDERWDWNDGRTVSNFIISTAKIVEQICLGEGRDDDPHQSDILIFMPGMSQIKEVYKVLSEFNERLARQSPKDVFLLLIMNSDAVRDNNDDYIAMKNNETQLYAVVGGTRFPARRRIIISTNVAETGLTLPFLKYVIDAGLNKGVEYEPQNGIRAIITTPAPQSRIRQRRGRVGRRFRGVFFPLYPKYIYDALPPEQLPQILTENINTIILEILNQQEKLNFDRLGMLTSPSPAAIAECREKLYELGLIEPIIVGSAGSPGNALDGGLSRPEMRLTPLGEDAVKIDSIAFEAVRAILAAWCWEVWPLDMITGVAFWMSPWRLDPVIDEVLEDDLGIGPEFLMLLGDDFIKGILIFISLQRNLDNLEAWCEKTAISPMEIQEFLQLRDDIIDKFVMQEFNIRAFSENALAYHVGKERFTEIIARIKQCIYDGWRTNLLTYSRGDYMTRRGALVKYIYNGGRIPARKTKKSNGDGGESEKIRQPKNILALGLTLKQVNPKVLAYEIVPTHISVMDGWVAIDQQFNV